MKRTLEFWQGHVEAAKREAMPTSDYARLHGVPVKSLYRWQRTLKAVPAAVPKAGSPSAFVSVRVADGVLPRATSGYTLMLGQGVRLEMSALPSPDWLAALVRASQGAG